MNYLDIADKDYSDIKKNILVINDRNFFNPIVERGKKYYEQGKILELKKIDEKLYSAIVAGSENYKVNVTMNGKFCFDANCTCPFNVADEDYINPKLCKHIYASYMAIYEVENKEYMNNVYPEYIEKYSKLYLDLNTKLNKYDLNSDDKIICENLKTTFTNLLKTTEDTYSDKMNSQNIINLLYKYIEISSKTFDKLDKILLKYENIAEDNITDKIKEEQENIYENEKNEEHKESFLVKLLKIIGAVLLGIFAGLTSSTNIEDDTEEDNVFSHGDTVIVKYSGKVGVIISAEGNYYTVKLKDEFENEYYASYNGNELESYY